MQQSAPIAPLPAFRKVITVLLAEDHTIVRQGLKTLLESEGDIKIVGEATNGRLAVDLSQAMSPDIILMDIAMPELNGLEATRQILKARPESRIILLSAYKDDAYIEQAAALGAAGYLSKQSSLDSVAAVIRQVYRGRVFYSPDIARHLMKSGQRLPNQDDLIRKKINPLTSRETEVLQLVAEGQANKQVAGKLGISIKTVEKHRQHLMEKLDIHDTAGLTRHAIATGIIESSVHLTITD